MRAFAAFSQTCILAVALGPALSDDNWWIRCMVFFSVFINFLTMMAECKA